MATVALSGIITPTNVVTATSTTTLTNKTLTGAVVNGTVGATTPSTGAFTSTSATGQITGTNAAGTAAIFSGYSTKSGAANAAHGEIKFGTNATQSSRLTFDANDNVLYIDTLYDNIASGTKIRTNTSGTPVVVGSFTPSGLAVTGLVDISAATSGQIKFPATQNASTNANTLDDYEEGTWTPTVIGTTVAGTASYSIQTGVYTKIGQLVSVAFRVDYSGGTGTGNLRISGLPFTATNTFNRYGGLEVGDISLGAGNYAVGSVESNTTKVVISTCPTGGGAGGTAAYDSSGYIIFNSTYYV